tara:strand:+ start:452 stop:652 length:201 start_codon:yes stop_codon:yes gene_type:complete
MVFHGDYEIEFEIHKDREDSWRTDHLGHISGMSAQEALARWVVQHNIEAQEAEHLIAIPVINGSKV